MALTHESVLSRLINEGGKVRKNDMVSHFKGLLDCADPADKQRNRDLFKTLVNGVATVREEDGVRYVVLKRRYRHPRGGADEPDRDALRGPGGPGSAPERPQEAGGGSGAADGEGRGDGRESPPELLSPVELALRRSQSGLRSQSTPKVEAREQRTGGGRGPSKPYALPLRTPAPARAEVPDPDPDPPTRSTAGSPRIEERPPLTERGCPSAQPRRAARGSEAPEEPREAGAPPPAVPLEVTEHEWLVKCAAGHWGQVYGLLLRDTHLAQKRDFMSGFTALHWAAKSGNHEMLVKIIDVAKEGGVHVDVNAKTHGGYTPLHIAALHKKEYIAAMLVAEYGADPSIRDNCGKRPHHYLQGGGSGGVREMLGQPPAPERPPERAQGEREEADLSRGRHSISRLFQPHAGGQKKKPRQRPGLVPLSEEPPEEQPE